MDRHGVEFPPVGDTTSGAPLTVGPFPDLAMASRDFYTGFGRFYDLQMASAGGRDDLDFYLTLAASTPGPVLELGCGTGRLTLPLVCAGAEVTGMDLSPDMLKVARHKAKLLTTLQRTRLQWIQGDMANFNLGRTFSLVLAPFRAFQHLTTTREQRACLACVRRHLTPGGLFVLDIFDPDLDILTDRNREKEYGEEKPVPLPEGGTLTVRYRTPEWNPDTQVSRCQNIYILDRPGGQRDRLVQEFLVRWTYRNEAERLLEISGFKVKRVFGGYRGEPVGAGELVFLAEVPSPGTSCSS